MERLGEGWKVGHGSVPIVGGVSGVCASQLSREPLCTSVMSPAANERANKQTASLAGEWGSIALNKQLLQAVIVFS